MQATRLFLPYNRPVLHADSVFVFFFLRCRYSGAVFGLWSGERFCCCGLAEICSRSVPELNGRVTPGSASFESRRPWLLPTLVLRQNFVLSAFVSSFVVNCRREKSSASWLWMLRIGYVMACFSSCSLFWTCEPKFTVEECVDDGAEWARIGAFGRASILPTAAPP